MKVISYEITTSKNDLKFECELKRKANHKYAENLKKTKLNQIYQTTQLNQIYQTKTTKLNLPNQT